MHLCILFSPYADALPPSVPSPLSPALGIYHGEYACRHLFSPFDPVPDCRCWTLGNNAVILSHAGNSRQLVKMTGQV
jgi:hypothetical protein